MTTHTLEFNDAQTARHVYGRQDENLKAIAAATGLKVSARGATVQLEGEDEAIELATRVLFQLFELIKAGYPAGSADVTRSVGMLRREPDVNLKDIFLDTIYVASRNRVISPKGLNQKRYVDKIRKNDIVFGIGPAGTGKTYLAMAMALDALSKKDVRRVVLTRPAVEAGERLGFLPGDLMEKVSPYLRPLYDALHDMMDGEKVAGLIEAGTIEVAPLAFMRGRTLNDAFVILDEAQNTTKAQMKMFLTRLGFNSKAVITGDITQTDLPDVSKSGLRDAQRVLTDIRGIGFNTFTHVDVVRHPLVMKIIKAYAADDERRASWAAKAKAEAEADLTGG